MKRRILDLYCCAGGAGAGYMRAGFDVVGVDRKRHRSCPYDVLEADALTLDLEFIRSFDGVHASPPCQGLTEMNNDKSKHLNLIPQTRDMLERAGVPFVIENVRAARAHLRSPVSLFGTMFGLGMETSQGQRFVLSRERLFETNWRLVAPYDPGPQGLPIANVIGAHLRCRQGEFRTGKGTGKTVDFPGEDRPALAAALMEMPWATLGEMSEAVPPAYTHWIGTCLQAYLDAPDLFGSIAA